MLHLSFVWRSLAFIAFKPAAAHFAGKGTGVGVKRDSLTFVSSILQVSNVLSACWDQMRQPSAEPEVFALVSGTLLAVLDSSMTQEVGRRGPEGHVSPALVVVGSLLSPIVRFPEDQAPPCWAASSESIAAVFGPFPLPSNSHTPVDHC